MSELLFVATIVMTVVPLTLFFGWIACKHPTEGVVTWGVGAWLVLLLAYGWWILGYPEAHFDSNGLAPLIAFIAGVVFWLIKYQKVS